MYNVQYTRMYILWHSLWWDALQIDTLGICKNLFNVGWHCFAIDEFGVAFNDIGREKDELICCHWYLAVVVRGKKM